MALGRKILKHSAVYYLGSFFDQSIQLLLLPVYTRVLAPEEMGIISVSRALGAVVLLLLALGLHGGASRLYFDYRDKPRELKEFWGTLFIFLALFSGLGGTALAIWGESLLKPFIADVAYRPFIVLVLMHATLTPFINTYLRTLQTRQQSVKYVLLNSSRLLLTLLLIVFLVVVLKMGAVGPLLGYAMVAGVYWIITAALLRGDVIFCFRWHYLRHALGYSLPIIPASVSTRVGTVADRVIINRQVGQQALGVYDIGFSFGAAIEAVAMAVNTAFSPVFRDAMKTQDEGKLHELRHLSLFLVYGYCVLGTGLSFFAREIVAIVAGSAYHAAFIIVPFIAFVSVWKGIYFMFASVLLYFRLTLWFAFLISIIAMTVNITLNLRWIPEMGIVGAGLAALVAQMVVTVLSAVMSYRHTRVPWQYGRYAALVIFAMIPSLLINALPWEQWWIRLAIKVPAFPIVALVMSAIAWGDCFHVFRVGKTELARLGGAYKRRKQT